MHVVEHGVGQVGGGDAEEIRRTEVGPEELGRLSRYDRPLPELSEYDRLLGGAA